MAEEIKTGEVSNQGNVSAQPTAQPTSQPTQNAPAAKYTDADVDRIVASKIQKGYEKGKQDAFAEWQTQQGQQPTSQHANTPVNGQNAQSDNLDRIVEEKIAQRWQQQQQQAQKQAYEQQAAHIANEINTKLAAGKERYSDFNDVVKPDALAQMPELALLANSFENLPDIMYDMMKNPAKLATINSLVMAAKINNTPFYYDLARNELQKLSESIRNNQSAVQNTPQISEPLSQLKPSNVGADNGSRTVSDIRKDPRYRV